ncbi:MAG: hypothetical protein ACYDFT_04155 [Thermoplasmata archaeon]
MAALGAVLVALALALTGLPGATAAAPLAAGASSNTVWAYGVEKNVSLTVTTNQTTYAVGGYFADHVLLNQTNTSNSTFMLELVRTEGFAYTAEFCRPSCSTNAVEAIVIHDWAWEQDVGFANFTRNGSVYENGSAVPALALVNASARTQSNLTESANFTVHTPLRNVRGNASVEVAISSTSSVSFSPALGLVPTSLAPGAAWNATSTFSAHGAVSGSITHARTNSQGLSISGRTRWNPAVDASGTVRVAGRDQGHIQLSGGAATHVLGLSISGPFAAGEGILFVPAGADLFGSGAAAYSGYSAGSSSAATASVDWNSGASGHVGLMASSTAFAPAPDGASLVGGSPATIAGVAPPVSLTGAASSPSGGAVVQAEPESPAAASSGSTCIVQGSCAPQPNPSLAVPGGASGLLTPLLRAAVAGAVIVGLAGLLAGLIVRRRQVPKPPTDTPAFPPRAGSAAAGLPSRPGTPDPGSVDPTPEEDPLGPLW